MGADDDRLGRELAERARLFLLWLEDNELPGLPGLRDKHVNEFEFYAGIYRRRERRSGSASALIFDTRLPRLWARESDERARFFQLGLRVNYLLLAHNPNDMVTLPDGRSFVRNRIVPTIHADLSRPGALIAVEPHLTSLVPDDSTVRTVCNWDFAAILPRVDLVHDDAATAAAVGFAPKYRFIFDYEAPRTQWAVNVQDVPVPEELDPPPGPHHDKQLAQVTREFRDYLYATGTYHRRRYVPTDGGGYYGKWKAKRPVAARQRVFRPTLLSDEYLKECFTEHVMKRGDFLILLDLAPYAQHVFRLLWTDPPRTAASPKTFTVEPLFTLQGTAARPPTGGAAGPVRAVVFYAQDGANEPLPNLRLGKLDYHGGLSERFLVDYKAYVRWYHDDARLDLGEDRAWFDRFVEIFFGDRGYPMRVNVLPATMPTREEVFLGFLRQAATLGLPGPVQQHLADLVKQCDDDNTLWFFLQGMAFGTDDRPRELIGVTPAGDVFEWHPLTQTVTTMALDDWLREFRMKGIAAEVYRGSEGLLPFIAVVTFGGALVMTAPLGLPAALARLLPGSLPTSMTWLSRTVVPALALETTGRLIKQQVARAAKPLLVAAVVEAGMSLIPADDSIVYEFIKGLFHGLGGGAAEHYLSEVDDRLERLIDKVPTLVANKLTRNGYRAYVIYTKVNNARIAMTGLIRGLRAVLDDKRARVVADGLSQLSVYLGVGFLTVLFVVVYMDFVVRSRQDTVKDAEKWVKEQQKALKWMVAETGNEIKGFLAGLRKDLEPHRGDLKSPAVTDKVRQHSAPLAGFITNKLQGGITAVPAIGEFLRLMLAEVGVTNVDELRALGLTEVLTRGVSALNTPGFRADQAHKVGAAVGELIGTIVLERRIVPASTRAKTGLVLFDKSQRSRAALTVLEGGTLRALLEFALFPFEGLFDIPASVMKGLERQGGPAAPGLTRLPQRDSSYREFVRFLVNHEEELARRLAKLAVDEGLEAKLDTLIASAADAANLPPALTDLMKADRPDWPAEAIIYVLSTWLRLGLHTLLKAFTHIEDQQPYGGADFSLAKLLEIMGLDVALDDRTLANLKATFTKMTRTTR